MPYIFITMFALLVSCSEDSDKNQSSPNQVPEPILNDYSDYHIIYLESLFNNNIIFHEAHILYLSQNKMHLRAKSIGKNDTAKLYVFDFDNRGDLSGEWPESDSTLIISDSGVLKLFGDIHDNYYEVYYPYYKHVLFALDSIAQPVSKSDILGTENGVRYCKNRFIYPR